MCRLSAPNVALSAGDGLPGALLVRIGKGFVTVRRALFRLDDADPPLNQRAIAWLQFRHYVSSIRPRL